MARIQIMSDNDNTDFDVDEAILIYRRTIAENILGKRKSLHWTQERLSELSGISTDSISKIERCLVGLSDKTLVKIAHAFGVKPGVLTIDKKDGLVESVFVSDRLNEILDALGNPKYKLGKSKRS